MNRRGFLKAALAVPAAPLVPAAAPTLLYGGIVAGGMANEWLLDAIQRAINPPVIFDGGRGVAFLPDTSEALRDYFKACGKAGWLK